MKKNVSSLAYIPKFKFSYCLPQYWPVWLGMALLYVLIFLPPAWVDALARVLGNRIYTGNRKQRLFVDTNLELCFPDLSRAQRDDMAKQHFRAQARSLLHYGLFILGPRWLLRRRIVFKGEEQIQSRLDAGGRVILLTSHSVGLEAAVTGVTMRYPATGPFKAIKNPLVNYLVGKSRTRFDSFVYTREAGLRPIIRDVRNGYVMVYLADEDLGEDAAEFVPFFGVPKATISVLGRLAKSCRADVLPCVSCYDETSHRYVIHVLPALENFPRGDAGQDALAMNQAIEETVRICPHQYFWTLRFFKTRPAGEERFY